jgi:hypothetical protein
VLKHRASELVLSFDPLALERCYLVADILLEEFDEPFAEYGLLGLADRMEPFRVIATPLLVGQSVTAGKVEQPGRQVLRMRDEMERLAHRLQRPLVPIAFIHRHPGHCDASATDESFLRGVFVDQVSTVVSFRDAPRLDAADSPCPCVRDRGRNPAGVGEGPPKFRGEHSVAFSLIVNRERDHRLYAVRKATCGFCGRSAVSDVPARIGPGLPLPVSERDRVAMRGPLEREIRAKISFDRDRVEIEELCR